MILNYNNFSDFLKDEFSQRLSRNASYSLRSFSRDLQISPSNMSELMQGKKGMSFKKLAVIAKKLGLKSEETEYLALLAKKQGQKIVKKNNSLEKNVAELINKYKANYSIISIDTLKVISEWQHFALLELIHFEPSYDVSHLAKRLGVSSRFCNDIIKRLVKLDLLEIKDNQLFDTNKNLSIGSQIPSDRIKFFHEVILSKAIAALKECAVNEREVSSSIFSFSKDSIEEARKDLVTFRRSFSEKYNQNQNQNSVYCFSLQFFELTKEVL